MNAKSTISLAVLAATMFAGTANAEPRWPNWYIGLHGGWSMDDSYDSTTAGTTTEVDTDGGYLLGASLGYVPPTELPFFNQTRYELEYSYRTNDIEAGGTGEVEANSLMGNMLLDFTNTTKWTPYAGFGVGMANVDVDGDDDSVFAWQLLAGLDYEPESLPMTVWGIRYRYFNAQDADLDVAGTPVEFEYDDNHSIEATARFRF